MRKIFTLLSLAVALSAPVAGAAPTLSFSGSGTQADPYLIKTKADLVELSKATSTDEISQMGNVSAFKGVYFKLANDINLENTAEFKGICTTSNTTVAKSINFQGVFDGDGHTISGMSLEGVVWTVRPTENTLGTPNAQTSRTGTGFIGQLGAGGQIKNLNIAGDCRISGYKETGAVVGSAAAGSKIENCRNYATVTGYSVRVGGVVGYVANGEVVSCFNAGNVTGGDSSVGGIGGHILGKISYCANTGDVAIKGITTAKPEGSTSLVGCGGIAGRANMDVISNCLNTGNVSAYDLAGGITYDFYCIKNCINYGMVTTTGGKECGAIGGKYIGSSYQSAATSDNYYDAQILTCGAVAGAPFKGINGCATSELTTVTAPANFDSNIWQFANGRYPVLKQFASETTLAQASQIVLTLGAGETVANISTTGRLSSAEGLKWTLNNGARFTISGTSLNVPSTKMTEPDMLTATYGTLVKRIPILYTGEGQAAGPFEGDGTEASPWLLKSKEDLIKLSQLTCASTLQEALSKEKFVGKYFALANDIDLAYSEDFKGISVANDFKLKNDVCFCGILDGRGHSIKNMKIGRVAWTVKPADAPDGIGTLNQDECHNIGSYSSFIGRIGNGGVVKNLVIDKSCRIEGYSAIGGIAAEMTGNARIENCRNYADVTAFSSVAGGIVGRNMAGTTVKGCYNAGNVTTGALQAGGISGNNVGTIEECVNAGDVTSKHLTTNIPENQGYNSNVGGIAGFATEGNNIIRNCLNLGTVSGEQEVGGLLGTFGLAEFCLNYGIVNSQNTALSGNIFGNKASMAGKFPIKLYYDRQINRVMAVSNEDFTFNPGGGGEKEPVTIPILTSELVSGKVLADMDETLWQFDAGMYPVLKQFADEAKVKAGRTTIAEMAQNNNAAMVTEAITLRPAEGLVWTCDDYFNIIKGIAYSVKTGQGTITATNAAAGYTKKFYCAIYKVAGVEDLINEKEVASTCYYTLDGLLVTKPLETDGRIYIVVINYTDGTSRTVKMLNK